MKHAWLSEVIFWAHLPIVVLWFGLFLVPRSLWPGRVTFHFWYIVGIILVQLLWAVFVFRKVDIICPLTTWMQWLKGYGLRDKKNYGHSFIAELLERLNINISYQRINVVLIITLVMVVIQYFFFR